MRERILKILNEASSMNNPFPDYLYHGTPRENLESILQNGLDPESAKQGAGSAVYLGIDFYTASNYAGMHGKNQEEWVVFRVDTTYLDPDYAEPDDGEFQEFLDELDEDSPWYGLDWDDLSWEDSLEHSWQIRYTAVIPPEAIEVVEE